MKITYITHACLLVEIGKLKILTDPWLVGPCWGGTLWHYPTHNYTPKNLPKPDIIFFSHGHDDHFHFETINNFPKSWFNSLIIAPNYDDQTWKNEIKKRFKNIKYLFHNEKYSHKKINFQLFINDKGDPDSSLLLHYKNINIFLQTDNLMSFEEAKRIGNLARIDFAFTIPFLTGVFPGFYKMNTDQLLLQAKKKIQRSLDYCFNVVKNLNPKFVIPYACDIGYLGDKFPINLIHTHNKNDLALLIKKKKPKIKTIILNSGDYIKYSNKVLSKSISEYIYNNESLIRFSNEKLEQYLSYQKEEKKLLYPKYKNLVLIFKNILEKNLSKIVKFNFTLKILIKDTEEKNKYLFLDFNKKKIKIYRELKRKTDLSIDIESYKIRNLLNNKYPMNFLTFHNGGYTCERANMDLSEDEKKYWSWINNLSFC